jgi:hypothetical protein
MAGITFPEGSEIFLLAIASRPVQGTHPVSYPMGVGCKAEVKNPWNYTSTLTYVFMGR